MYGDLCYTELHQLECEGIHVNKLHITISKLPNGNDQIEVNS